MKKTIILLGLVALLAVGAFQIADAGAPGGGFGYQSVQTYLRTPQYDVTINVLTDGDVTPGLDGVAIAGLVGGLANASDLTWTSSIAALPYPCAPMIEAVDVGSDTGSAISCTGDIDIRGRNQFGIGISENLTATIDETGYRTNRIYETITYFKVTDVTCTNDADVDIIRVACDGKAGLPFPIRGTGAVLTVCHSDASSNQTPLQCFEGADIAEDIDLDDHAIDLTTVGNDDEGGDITEADGDRYIIRMRSPEGL